MTFERINYLLEQNNPYNLRKESKRRILTEELSELDKFHYINCDEYRNIIDAHSVYHYALPVRMFKLLNLRSIEENNVFKILSSSGTTSQVVSRINLDKETAQLQTKVLVHIMQSFLGKTRLPMLIIDHPGVVKDRKSFSARGAGILGLSNFGRQHTYALDDEMNLNYSVIDSFLSKNKEQRIFIFGFTFMIWQYLIQKLKVENKFLDLSNAIIIHSGGWKKLQDQAVDNTTFKTELFKYCGLKHVHNFYGMVEQVGSIYVECEEGYLHCPNFSDVDFIDIRNMRPVEKGESGVIMVESIIPRSYPGHRLLTEDIGYQIGEDDCKCGRKGKYFAVTGRIPKAEVRGCSDTHESKGK